MKVSLMSINKLTAPQKNPKMIPALIFKSLRKKSFKTSMLPLSEDDLEHLVKTLNIDKAQIDAQYQIFLNNHPDGTISKKSIQSPNV